MESTLIPKTETLKGLLVVAYEGRSANAAPLNQQATSNNNKHSIYLPLFPASA